MQWNVWKKLLELVGIAARRCVKDGCVRSVAKFMRLLFLNAQNIEVTVRNKTFDVRTHRPQITPRRNGGNLSDPDTKVRA